MKRILYLLILFTPLILPAQNWQNICSPGTTIFNRYDLQQRGIRWDSIYSPGTEDTTYFSFPNVQEFGAIDCIDTTDSGILGDKVVKKGNGLFWLFNRNNDTIFFSTMALVNDTWEMFHLDYGEYIQATVLYQYNDTVLGIVDSVKLVQLQAKDSNQVNISHIFNQKIILLSQQYGFARIYDLRNFPSDTNTYLLAGKTDPALGIQQVSWTEVITFDVGDEFHFYKVGQGYGGWASDNIIEKVLEKIQYGSDSVDYYIERCEEWVSYGVGGPVFWWEHDTSWVRYQFWGVNPLSSFDQVPQSFYPNSPVKAHKYNWFYNHYKGRRVKEIVYDYYKYIDTLSCWVIKNWYQYPIITRRFGEGLGCTYEYERGFSFPSDYSWEESLVYYKKGSETWGTPISTDCTTLVPIEDTPTQQNEILIYPNPASTYITIEKAGEGHLSILNLNGQILITRQITESKTQIDVSRLPSGVYILKLVGRTGVRVSKFVKQ